ncbi:AA_TRNA_LIGASE_II domain-containing protein, partial [Haematococcus lacustris]
VSGQKFYYLRNAGALLELALVNWAMSRVVARGFTPIMTPDLVKETVLEKCGFQPRGEGTQVYSVEDSPLCLTGTAEVPLGGLYMDKVLREAELPIRMVAYGHCFRTEAGAAGAAGKGLYRVHQFSKVCKLRY